MEFDLNASQKEIQRAAREFARGEFDRNLPLDPVAGHQFPKAIWRKAAELGFIGVHYPECYDGQGLGVTENVLIAEAFCRQDSTIGSAVILANFASELVLRFGSAAQKERWLPPLARGEILSGGAFTEPDHGSDITRMNTTAERQADGWVIDGAKTFITNGGLADVYCVLCQTDPGAAPSHRGMSVFIVEADRPGITVTDIGPKMGIHMMATAELAFKAVHIPDTNLLGELNRGFYHVLEFFDESRILVAAQGLGTAQGAFDRALNHVRGREQFGRKLAQFQVTQHKLADMATQLELTRLITYKAASRFDDGRLDPSLTAMAKLVAGRTAVTVCDEAIQLMGGYGYTSEYEVERFYRDAKITEIYEGTREIQKNTIAAALIGKLK